METIELRYFLRVAETQNIHAASNQLNISPSAISKAISRLEQELEVKLFEKVGRNIKITDVGRSLVKDASEMLALEKRVIEGYSKDRQSVSIRMIGAELPLARWSPVLIRDIQKRFPKAAFALEPVENNDALNLVENYSADLAILTSATKLSGKMYKKLADVEFKTYLSKEHPLASQRGGIEVKDLIKERFIVTDPSLLGLRSDQSYADGWRDDKYKRSDVIFTRSIKCLEGMLIEGLAISYLPEYYGESLGLKHLEVLGCPYSCNQAIYIARNKYSLDSVWSAIKDTSS